MITRISFLALTTSLVLVSRGASLVENVAAVEECRVAITNAIVAKGGTASGALTNAAAEIAALPSGSKIWDYPADWPVDWIKSEYAAHKDSQYPNQIIFLLRNVPNIRIYVEAGTSKAFLDDGSVLTATAYHTFNDTNRWHYAIFYAPRNARMNAYYFPYDAVWAYGEDGSSIWAGEYGGFLNALEVDLIDATYSGGILFTLKAEYVKANTSTNVFLHNVSGRASSFFNVGHSVFYGASSREENLCNSRPQVRYISGFDTSGRTTFRGLFSCGQLEEVNFYNDTMDTSGVTGTSMDGWCIFSGAFRLKRVPPVIDFSRFYTVGYMFSGCAALEYIPDIIDFSGVNDSQYGFTGGVFAGCVNLKRLPTYFTSSNPSFSYTISFADSRYVDKQSLAIFSDGVMTGGMVYNLNDVTNDGGYTRTITLPNTLRAKFTSEEASTIISAANAKGWTLGNFAL